jgi:hypothetical protein
MRTLVTCVIPLLALTACTQAAPNHQPVSKEEATRIAEQAEATFTTGDVKAIMRQYADGAVMFDASHGGLSTDRKVQTDWAQSFVSMKPADYHVPDRQIQIVGADGFVSSGTEMFTVAAGAARPTISARFTDVYQRQKDGSWKIINEHVSMPPSSAPANAQ